MKTSAFAVLIAGLCIACIFSNIGCIQPSDNEVVVFTALDREFSDPILNDIGQELDLTIRPKFDMESNKTIGLATSIIENATKPQADVFWNNEILHTLRLKNLGLLDVYKAIESENYPPSFYSSEGDWYGFAARARVMIVNTDRISDPTDYPDSFLDLADEKWKGQCAMARPLFGTTATHAAVLFAKLGRKKAESLLKSIASNATIVGGNKQVALKVSSGEFAFGVTDTDDAMIEIEKANPVAIVFPDQGDKQEGTLLIPNTLAVIKKGPHPEAARKLVDRLLKADIEQRLAEGSSAQIPLNRNCPVQSRVEPVDLKVMEVDFEEAAEIWDSIVPFLNETFPAGGQ
ncbi:MAG: extracellular solute-binding protein [Planctomycetota bacterium]